MSILIWYVPALKILPFDLGWYKHNKR